MSLLIQLVQRRPQVLREFFSQERIEDITFDLQQGYPGEAPEEVVAGGEATEGGREGGREGGMVRFERCHLNTCVLMTPRFCHSMPT